MNLCYLLSHLFTACVFSLCLSCSNPLFGVPAGTWTAYVTNNQPGTGAVPIDTATNTPGAPNPISFPANSELAYIAITPDGTTAYVTDFFTETGPVIFPIDTATNTLGTPISLTSYAHAIAITPNGKTIYVANRNVNTVTPIDIATQTAGIPITGFLTPAGIAITPDGTTAYVSNHGSNTVTTIDIATNMIGTTITVGLAPFGIAITPDGTTAYVANSTDNTVTPIDIATNMPEALILLGPLGLDPQFIAITPDGTTAYVSNFQSHNVTPIDIATGTAGTPINVGEGPVSIAITPDGITAYVDLFDPPADQVMPIDIATDAAGTPIIISTVDNPPPLSPLGIAITPDQAPTASFTFVAAPDGSQSTFDASASSSPVGVVTLYAWDFGDRTLLTTSNPTTSHVYNVPGTYTVTLVVTNSAGTSTTQVFTGQTVSRNGGPSARLTHDITIMSSAPLPPSRFEGVIRRNKFLNRTEYILLATWEASPSPVSSYLIYKDGALVGTVLATDPLVFRICLHHCKAAEGYAIAAVDLDNQVSDPIPLIIIQVQFCGHGS